MDAASKLELVDKISLACFGDWKHPEVPFPLPMSEAEAGPSPSGQRRYLWTDAFGILNFVSQAKLVQSIPTDVNHYTEAHKQQAAKEYLSAASKLIDAVWLCLGNPRSPQNPMLPDNTEQGGSGGGYQGLRIGKTLAKNAGAFSEFGMTYDGMYWHYIDKFIFAVARYIQESGDASVTPRLVRLVKQVHRHFYVPHRGYHWKINCDCSPIGSAMSVYPNGDAVTAMCVYNVVNSLTGVEGALADEVEDLRGVVQEYFDSSSNELSAVRQATDPLGLGMSLWMHQWVSGPKPARFLQGMKAVAHQVIERNAAAAIIEPQMNFRLYGALLGAQMASADSIDEQLCAHAKSVLQPLIGLELGTAVRESGHVINKVMLATAINPIAFGRYPSDPVVHVASSNEQARP